MSNVPDPAHTAQFAHDLWVQEGRPEGRADHHWQRAEKLLKPQPDEPVPTGDEDPDSFLSSTDSERAAAERGEATPGAPVHVPGT